MTTRPPLTTAELEALRDPFRLGKLLWPDVDFYDRQREIIRSVWDNMETVVPAGHMLGKDFVAAFICLVFFLTRHPVRVVTTSVDYTQLEGVLWGEIRRFIQTSRIPLEADRGGPLVINHMHIRKVYGGEVDGLSYLTGRVAAKGEGMSGHHIADVGDGVPRTLFCGDEVSGVDQLTLEKPTEWANRYLLIGNPYECNNQFKWAVEGRPGSQDKGGDIPHPASTPASPRYLRKIIRIRAEDSPNVKLALMQQHRGVEPTGDLVVPGVLPYNQYLHRLATWDQVKRCVGMDACFWKGAAVLMFPPEWLNRAERWADSLRGRIRHARAIGIDPAEGGDKTAMTAVDEYGIIEQVSRKTPDTADITGELIDFARRHNVPPDYWVFDAGGGGKQHADRLRRQGYLGIRTVRFGESLVMDPRRGLVRVEEKKEHREERYVYKNRRAQLYGALREKLSPANPEAYGLPAEYWELRRQLAPIPLTLDGEGRLVLPPKKKRSAKDTMPTLEGLIGCSPDEADSAVLALYSMQHKSAEVWAGVPD